MNRPKQAEIDDLLELSARIGGNPLLVQASAGNTSVKLDGALWIKASGKWLRQAKREEILIPVDLSQVRRCVCLEREFGAEVVMLSASPLRPSIETAMHAVLPHRVVVHVHSVNTIAWAVRQDAPARLQELLAGLKWQWIPYSASGLALARRVERAVSLNSATDVFVLGNHGLVVGAHCCQAAEALLGEVEKRLALLPRQVPKPDLTALSLIAGDSEWSLPPDEALHALATDTISESLFSAGTLYPCQGIFLSSLAPPFLLVSGSGLVISARITRAEYAVLLGLVQVVRRIEATAPIRYLLPEELDRIMNLEAHRYRQVVENDGACLQSFSSHF